MSYSQILQFTCKTILSTLLNNDDNTNINKGKVKMVKVPSLQAMKAHRGCECKGPHIRSQDTRKIIIIIINNLVKFLKTL